MQIASLIAFIVVILFVAPPTPFSKAGRFSLVNKEPGFVFDGNRALEQVLSVFNQPVPESPESTHPFANPVSNEDHDKLITKLSEKLAVLGEKTQTEPKLNILIENSANDLFSLSLGLVGVALALAALATFFAIKYFSLKKNFFKLQQISQTTLAASNEFMNIAEARAVSLLDAQRRSELLTAELRKSTAALEKTLNDLGIARDLAGADGLPSLIKNIHRNQSRYVSQKIDFMSQKFRAIAAKAIDAQTRDLIKNVTAAHTNFISSRKFNDYSENHSFLIYTALSLVIFTSVLDFGLSEVHREVFVSNLNDQPFYSTTNSPFLNIFDFTTPRSSNPNDSSDPCADWRPNLWSADATWERFHKISKRDLQWVVSAPIEE